MPNHIDLNDSRTCSSAWVYIGELDISVLRLQIQENHKFHRAVLNYFSL
jgi:hypothetical protein